MIRTPCYGTFNIGIWLWVSGCCLSPNEQIFSYIIARATYFQWNDDDEIHFVRDQHAELDLIALAHWSNSSRVGHVDQHWQITPIPNKPVFALSPQWCVLIEKATHTNFSLWFTNTEPFLYIVYTCDTRNVFRFALEYSYKGDKFVW